MQVSIFDPYLLIIAGSVESFGIVGIQTDDTLLLGTEFLSAHEEMQLERARF